MGTLYTYSGNTYALQSLIIAHYNSIELSLPAFEMGKDNTTEDFLFKSPLAKVPVLQTAEGCICEAAAIARYLARLSPRTNMYGSTFFEAGLVDQWIEFAMTELDLPVGMWIYPILGFVESSDVNTVKAKEDVARALTVLNAHLLNATFLVGEGITAADVVVCCSLLNGFKLVFDSAFLEPFANVMRWFRTCVAQPDFTAVIGATALLASDVTASPVPKAKDGATSKKDAPVLKEKKEKAP